jgi:hypothetical protein
MFNSIQPNSESKYVAPIKTTPTPCGKIWRCANVPCKVVSNNGEIVKLLPFNSRSTTVLYEIFVNEFYHLENDETYVYITSYPNGRVLISEFDVKRISINKLKKHFKDKPFEKLIDKVVKDSFDAKGNTNCAKIEQYNKFKNDPKINKLERIGDPIFNRSVRHSPPISKSFTRENFENSPSFPAPIGIREEDFTLPSEQNEILIELLNQIFNCKNSPECPEDIINEIGLTINPDSHTCLWCGEVMDISELNQEYCSKEHSINFCHRIPEVGTKKGNVYIGHCSCNREQGGYSEEERIEQIIRLAKTNPSYREKILQSLLA